MLNLMPVATRREGEIQYAKLADWMLMQEPFDRGEVHAQKTTTPEMVTRELRNVTLRFEVSSHLDTWQAVTGCNLPWAEDHFNERISGEPLNPPPSEAYWPYAQQGNAAHKSDDQFSHTYPERFWPKFANTGGKMKHSERIVAVPIVGIRFEYGDLSDLVEILARNPRSRQAYLPVWFPEDLDAANHGERVPCTLGYHFQVTPEGKVDCMYPMRSCDMVRFLRDDVYMAGRLVQYVAAMIGAKPGLLTMHIANLHTFVGDEPYLRQVIRDYKPEAKRASYNFDGMY